MTTTSASWLSGCASIEKPIHPTWRMKACPSVASMLSMRSTSSLRDQGQGDWTDQGNWPATRSGGASPRGSAARLQAIRDDREDLQWEADGNQGSHPGAQRRTGSDQCPSPSGREVGRSLDGIDGLRRDPKDKSYSKEQGGQRASDSQEEPIPEQGEGEAAGQLREEGDPGQGLCWAANIVDGDAGTNCHERELRGHGGGNSGLRDRVEEGGVSGIWSSLRRLRSKMTESACN